MAYAATGTAGNDTLNQSGDNGPGTIVGLAGDDQILTGSGLATVTGDSGNDSVVLRAGNTGTVNGGSENDSISDGGTAIGTMQLLGGDGADTIWVPAASAGQNLVGGNDSNDGADSISGGTGGDLIFGNGGNDTLTDAGGNETYVGGFGNDSVRDVLGSDLVFGNQGNDLVGVGTFGVGGATGYGGLGNDNVQVSAATGLAFGNEGADTLFVSATSAGTAVGGNDSADGGDRIVANGNGSIIVFGNGGADTILGNAPNVTTMGGHGDDCIAIGTVTHLVFGNEGNDTIQSGGTVTAFGGLGNDTIFTGQGRDSLQGNEGNDSILSDAGSISIDTISGGAGNDVFVYWFAGDDGNNATGGGPVEFITDVNWSQDRVQTTDQGGPLVTFAANMGAGTGADLNASANNAIAAAQALSGGNTAWVAAQFTFAGRTYLAIDQAGLGVFLDNNDLLLDITGATGTIGAGDFTI
jgi:Ca2+-binding RTX toxin-like protein